MVALDHSSYPFIVDQIAFHDLSTQFIFRRLSTHWRDRVDAKLFRHIAIARPLEGTQLHHDNENNDDYDEESTEAVFEVLSPEFSFERLPCLPRPEAPDWQTLQMEWIEAPAPKLGREHRRQILENVHIVDYLGGRTSDIGGQFPNIVLLRRHVREECSITAPTTVQHVDFTAPYSREYATDVQLGTTITLDSGVKRHIIHLVIDMATPPARISLTAEGKLEVVEIFLRKEYPSIDELSDFIFGQRKYLKHLMQDIQPLVLKGVSVILAGMEVFRPSDLWEGAMDGHATATDALKSVLAADVRGKPGTGKDILSKVTFMTAAERKASHNKDTVDEMTTEGLCQHVYDQEYGHWYDPNFSCELDPENTDAWLRDSD